MGQTLMLLLDKTLILQGVKPTIQPLGVGYENGPKREVCGVSICTAPCEALF